MKLILTLACIITISFTSYSQSMKENEHKAQSYTYAYITVESKGLGKKLKVNVDLGDTPEQQKAGEEYSAVLTDKKSFAAVLNYMAENQFELVDSRDITESFSGTGGSAGVVFIMRKLKSLQ